MTATPNKGGRPPVADKRRVRGVRFNDAEWEAVVAAAESAGLTVAEWVRMRCALLPAAHPAHQ